MSIVEKGFNIARIVMRGASIAYPYDEVIHYREYPADFRVSNPFAENMLDEIFPVIASGYCIPFKTRLGISKGEILKFHAAFADQHRLQFSNKFMERIAQCEYLVRRIEKASSDLNRPVTIAEQLSISLDVFHGNVSEALLNLAVGTRAVARGYDTRLLPDLKVSVARIQNWRNVVAPFGFEQLDDPSGDTYHFWSSLVLGISARERDGIYNNLTGNISEFLARQTHLATDILRYRLFGKEGKTHPQADLLGLEAGIAIAHMYYFEPDSCQ
jgi:hypothetical protein